MICDLEIVIKGYEDNLGEPLRAIREDVESEWKSSWTRRREKEAQADELVGQLETVTLVMGLRVRTTG